MTRITAATIALFFALGCGTEGTVAVTSDEVVGVELPPADPIGGGGEGDPTDNLPTIQLPTPRIIVLVHGMLTNGGDAGELATARGYWSFEFVRGILGLDTGSIQTLAGTSFSTDRAWQDDATDRGAIRPAIASHAFVVAPLTADEAIPPSVTVAMTARDASVGLLAQSGAAADQIDMLLDAYKTRYENYFDLCGCEPQLVLVGHSMGGLVIRTILSNPNPNRMTFALNPGRTSYSNTTRRAMNTIRDRTLFAATLATPHDGTIFADRGQALIDYVETLPQQLNASTNGDQILATLLPVDTVVTRLEAAGGVTRGDLADAATTFVQSANPARGAIHDLTREYMALANASYLRPDRARRTAAADDLLGAGTGGQLVPIYTFGGRSPGSVHFTTPFLKDAVDGLASERESDQTNILLKIAIDHWMATYPGGYGTVGGSLAPFADEVDRVTRVNLQDAYGAWESAVEDELGVEQLLALLVGNEVIADWIADVLDTSPDVPLPIYLHEEWDVAMSGTGSIDTLAFSCDGTTRFASQTPGLSEALIDLHDQDARAFAGIMRPGTNVASILAAMFALLAEDAQENLQDIQAAFAAAVASLGPCADPRRWNVTTKPQTFPLPELVATGAPTSDGEVDSDGAVTYDSAMGLDLAGAATFGECDAWQRYFDSPFEAEYHEGLNIRGHLGRFLFDELVSQVGTQGVCP